MRHNLKEMRNLFYTSLNKKEKISEIQLDISEYLLILDVPEKYYLNLKLPFPVVSKDGNAKCA